MNLLTSDAVQRIAEAYQKAADDGQYINDADIHNMRKLINKQFSSLSKTIYFDFVDKDPYPYKAIGDFNPDWVKGVIKVNTSGNDSLLWGKVYNLQFRAIHDYIHCVRGFDFNYFNEVKAFHAQHDFSLLGKFAHKFPYMDWDLYRRVLRSEIVYQAAVKEHFGQFHIDQKIILSDL